MCPQLHSMCPQLHRHESSFLCALLESCCLPISILVLVKTCILEEGRLSEETHVFEPIVFKYLK
jgi:hypothetical protein